MQAPAPIREFTTRDTELIRREVLASGEPAVLRGLVTDWPAVGAGRSSAEALLAYLQQLRVTATPGPLQPRLTAAVPGLTDALESHLGQLARVQVMK